MQRRAGCTRVRSQRREGEMVEAAWGCGLPAECDLLACGVCQSAACCRAWPVLANLITLKKNRAQRDQHAYGGGTPAATPGARGGVSEGGSEATQLKFAVRVVQPSSPGLRCVVRCVAPQNLRNATAVALRCPAAGRWWQRNRAKSLPTQRRIPVRVTTMYELSCA